MITNKGRFRVVVNYKYSNGGYKEIPYWFDTEKQYDDWFKKTNSDQKIRKIIGLNKD